MLKRIVVLSCSVMLLLAACSSTAAVPATPDVPS
jgi:outer membrane biogenesis lipoprotein LolB